YTGAAAETPAVTTVAATAPSKTTTTTTTTTAASENSSLPLVKGDVNRDGKFTKRDLIMLNNYIANPETINYEKHYLLDANGDNLIDEKDSVYLLKIINKGN
ncbi:MAG: dockerin type I repeat-containing protein, partial [Oscillospiraceae bacterium]|nr:dockerin type I repeat-containing protein [Oscillospiraceae bacterium]